MAARSLLHKMAVEKSVWVSSLRTASAAPSTVLLPMTIRVSERSSYTPAPIIPIAQAQ
jgi:hypothetical protein